MHSNRMHSKCLGLFAIGMMTTFWSAIVPHPAMAESLQAESLQPHLKASAPHLDPRLEDLVFFVQEWQCESKRANQPEKIQIHWSVLRELNGFWFLGLKSDPQLGSIQLDTLGFNPIIQKFGLTVLGNDGRFGNLLSEGWDGNRMSWEGSLVNLATRTREKYRIVVAKTGEQAFESQDYTLDDALNDDALNDDAQNQAAWRLVMTQTCVAKGSNVSR